jgi:hypothetical protein
MDARANGGRFPIEVLSEFTSNLNDESWTADVQNLQFRRCSPSRINIGSGQVPPEMGANSVCNSWQNQSSETFVSGSSAAILLSQIRTQILHFRTPTFRRSAI